MTVSEIRTGQRITVCGSKFKPALAIPIASTSATTMIFGGESAIQRQSPTRSIVLGCGSPSSQ
jgi:hypothetical protein